MLHLRARGGRWLLAGQRLAGQAGADQAGHPPAATVAPTSTPVQHRPAAPSRPASAPHLPTSPQSSTGTSTRSSTGTSPQASQAAAARAVAFALAQLGKPYELDAEDPDADDCSGLVWQHAGPD